MASSHEIAEITGDLYFCSIDDQEKNDITRRLKHFDIHFNWSLHQTRPDGAKSEIIVSELNRKLKEMMDISNSELTFQSFCCQLTIAQELIKYDTASALRRVLECEPWVMSLKSGKFQENEFISIREAVEYIYLGCKAYALFTCGSISEAKEVLLNIPDMERMEEKQISGVYAVKACAFMEYGLQGFFKALEYISIARSKHPKMAEWHFLTGKLISRIRHIKYQGMPISDEEEGYFRTAYELDRNEPSYALYMAQTNREKAYGLFTECRYDREAYKNSLAYINRMNEEALSLYKMLVETNQNDSYILGRCAFGMVKLPAPYKRLDLAVDAIEKALTISPDNPLVNHYAGLIYHIHMGDYSKGLRYLERAANKNNYPALMDWMRLKYQLDPKNYDPLPELTKALEYTDFTSSTLTEIASWYFFKKLDVFSAWDHLVKVTEDHRIRNHKSRFLNMKTKCDLFEVIFDEVKLRLTECKYKDEHEKEKLMQLKGRLQILCPQSHPTDYSDLKSIIIEDSDSFNFKFSQKSVGSRSISAKTQEHRKDFPVGNFSRTRLSSRNSPDKNSSSFHMRGETKQSWRDSNSNNHERHVTKQPETLKLSRDKIDSNRHENIDSCAPETGESHSLDTASTRNVPTSKNKQSSVKRNYKIHERPLYYPKSESQGINSPNKF